MNPSKEDQQLIHTSAVPVLVVSGEYSFVYADEDLTIQVSASGSQPVDLVIAFVSYMKALGFSPETIERALYNKATVMKSFRVPGSILESKE